MPVARDGQLVQHNWVQLDYTGIYSETGIIQLCAIITVPISSLVHPGHVGADSHGLNARRRCSTRCQRTITSHVKTKGQSCHRAGQWQATVARCAVASSTYTHTHPLPPSGPGTIMTTTARGSSCCTPLLRRQPRSMPKATLRGLQRPANFHWRPRLP